MSFSRFRHYNCIVRRICNIQIHTEIFAWIVHLLRLTRAMPYMIYILQKWNAWPRAHCSSTAVDVSGEKVHRMSFKNMFAPVHGIGNWDTMNFRNFHATRLPHRVIVFVAAYMYHIYTFNGRWKPEGCLTVSPGWKGNGCIIMCVRVCVGLGLSPTANERPRPTILIVGNVIAVAPSRHRRCRCLNI